MALQIRFVHDYALGYEGSLSGRILDPIVSWGSLMEKINGQ